MKNKNTNSGITLIALIITIIVMLILVAVTISMAINGGLFEYAGKAVSETQNEINKEQQLANGKIKIGDKWYASIDDYINNNPITTGIEVNPAEIVLKKNAEGAEGTEVLNGTITASVFGMESEPEITWEKSSDAITLSATTGKTVTVGVAETQTEALEATVTAKCTYEGKPYTAQCKVTLEIIKPAITASIEKGAFVEYGVSYKDIYISEEYSTTNGWRLLDYTPNDDGTISNVKLISTGIPAKLYYYYNDTVNSSWYVTTESDLTTFKNVLGGESNYMFYTGGSTYYGLQASAGLYNNFGDIKFVYGTDKDEKSKGFYTSITANGTTYNSSTTGDKTGNDLFKVVNNVEKVRLLTLKELNEAVERTNIDSLTQISETEDSIGLFRLDKLSTVLSGYTYSSGYYWLASPCPEASTSGRSVCRVSYNGRVYDDSCTTSGVRPVVVLDSDISFSVSADKDATKNVTYLKLTPAS